MRRPEKQFWIYVTLLLGVFSLVTSGQLISCAKADPAYPTGKRPAFNDPPTKGAPWNAPGPQGPVSTQDAVSTHSSSGVTLGAQLDRGAVLQHSDGTVRVQVSLRTGSEPYGAPRNDSDLVVVVDTSGSMEGQKLHFARQALLTLINRLSPGDRLALIEYNYGAQVLAPLQQVTSYNRENLERTAYGLTASGSTNMSGGLDLGIALLNDARREGRPGRLLLLSDGLANAGDSSLYGLSERARSLSQNNFTLTTMGIGEDFDENTMTTLATVGSGAFYYLAKLNYLAEFFDAELSSAKNTYAQAAVLHFWPGSGVQVESAMGLPLTRAGGSTEIRLGNLYAARERTVWLTLRVPTYSLGHHELGSLSVSYERHGQPSTVSVGALPYVACLSDPALYEQQIHRSIWERALIEDVFSHTEEQFGDAIRTGDRRQLDAAYKRAEQERKLAQKLGSQTVLHELDGLEQKAASAARAQAAPAAERNLSAKKSKASGYQKRNAGAYDDAERAREAF